MRAVIQRVTQATVKVEGDIKGSIQNGLMVLIGIEEADNDDDVNWLVSKICRLRIFADEQGVMNNDVQQINGNVLLISQFTLHALTKKGNRPSYIKAARPEIAIPLYKKCITQFEHELNKKIETGIFGAYMEVSLVNDGPVTILIDSKARE